MKYIYIAFILALLPSLSFAHSKKHELYAFETSEGMKVGAVFGELPKVEIDDELISAEANVGSHVEIHMMQEVDGIMKMRKVASVPMLASKENKLEPMGYHLMLMGLDEALEKGDRFTLTLTFKNMGKKEYRIPIISRAEKPK